MIRPVERPAGVDSARVVPGFVGRRRELDALVAALPEHGGTGALRLVRGEPGAGKTRLTVELAAVAQRRGIPTIVGRCWEGGDAPPHWPWVHALRSLPGMARSNDLAELVGDDPLGGGDRFALFDSTAAMLDSITDDAPLVIVLDDLHDADVGSLLLARFLSLELDRLPVLIIGTYRPVEATQRPAVAEHLAALERAGEAITLVGLSVPEVAELLDDPDAAAEVHARTGGNPLFVLHHRADAQPQGPEADGTVVGTADGRVDGLPMGLRSAVRARLAPIEETTRTTLRAVAMLGPAAATRTRVAALSGQDDATVAAQVHTAVDAGLLRPVDESGELGLAHPLIGEVLVGDLDDDLRRSWHLAAAAQLEGDPEHRAEVAGHLIAAGSGHEVAALAACREAARQATDALSHEEAVAQHEAALSLLDRLGDDTRRTRCDVLLELGSARWRASRRPEADDAFAAATELAVELDDAEALALAALGGGFQSDVSGDAALRRAERLRAALARLPAEDSALRARLLANLVANEQAAPGATEARHAVGRADEALAMARRVGDPLALGYALVTRQVVELGPATLRDRIGTCREVLALAQFTDDHELALQGRFHLVGALLETGDLRAVDVELAAQSRVVDQIAEPAYTRHSLWFRCMRLMLEGRADDAEAVAAAGLAAANAASDPDGLLVYGGQLAVIRWLQGRVGEMEALWVDLRRDEPDTALWTATLAWLWATSGQLDAARGAVRSMIDLDDVAQDRHWLLTMTALAEAVAAVGVGTVDVGTVGEVATEELALAEDLRSRLLPYADRVVPIAMGIAWWGTVARPLGLLADALGRREEAGQHYASAIELTGQLGARPWLAQAQLDRAAWELAGDVVSDATARLVAEASATIDRYGPLELRGRAAAISDAVRNALGATDPAPAEAALVAEPATPEGVAGAGDPVGRRPRVVVLGTFEVTAADGTVARWTSRKARELLKYLVTRRGGVVAREELMEVLWPGQDPEQLSNRLSVAVSTVRRSLDPGRSCPTDELIAADRDSVRLRIDHVDVDVEQFLATSRDALLQLRNATSAGHDTAAAYGALGRAMSLYRGDPIADDPYAEWADPLRSETRSAVVSVARELARLAERSGDELLAVGAHRRVLEVDPYDVQAHQGLVRVFGSLGAHGQALHAQQDYHSAMAELGVEVEAE